MLASSFVLPKMLVIVTVRLCSSKIILPSSIEEKSVDFIYSNALLNKGCRFSMREEFDKVSSIILVICFVFIEQMSLLLLIIEIGKLEIFMNIMRNFRV